jgi:hypothetical protein
MIYAIALSGVGVLLTRDVLGAVMGAPVAIAAIARWFGIRDPSDIY